MRVMLALVIVWGSAAVAAAQEAAPISVTLEEIHTRGSGAGPGSGPGSGSGSEPAWVADAGGVAPARTAASSHYLRAIRVRADVDAEVALDRRLLRLEVRPLGSRPRARWLRCEHPDRPRRQDRLLEPVRAGQVWREWIDLRELCWGRPLAVLDAGAEVRAYYGSRRGRGAVARAGQSEHRELGPFEVQVPPRPQRVTASGSEQPIEVRLAPSDAATLGTLSLRVTVRATGAPVRVFVRPDMVGFEVRQVCPSPECERIVCHMPRAGGSPQPDLFVRATRSRGPALALEARQFCEEGLDAAGIYEVVPFLTLDESGHVVGVDGLTGRFTGEPVPVRIRRGTVGHLQRSMADGS